MEYQLKIQINNLRGVNLRGKNLSKINLSGIDLSQLDIRGAKFTNATLVGTNFHNVKAGLSICWTIYLAILLLFISLSSGLISGYSSALIGNLFNSHSFLFGNISLIGLGTFSTIILWRGLGFTFTVFAEIIGACLIVSIILSGEKEAGNAIFSVLILIGVIASVVNVAITLALAKIIAMPAPRTFTGLTCFIGIVIGILLAFRPDKSLTFPYFTFSLVCLLATALLILGVYVGWQAINGNKKYTFIRSLAVGITAYGGTSFRGANLTDADFTEATLASTDFREANLTRTCWFQSQNLSQARIEGTYLEEVKVRQLVITKDGIGQNFNNLNLRYLNLKNANLQDAEFISTDLSEANLHSSNLARAKLAQTQLYKANLTEACLTGAYIENWGISTDTQLDGIQCDHVYMRLPTKDDPAPWRKPDNQNESFKKGDFTDFVAPIIQTLDLYKSQNVDPRTVGKKFKTLDLLHYEGIDPTAAAIAITQLAESHPTANLELVALEGRGQEKIRLQAIVSNNANPSELNNEYFQRYTKIQSLSYSDLQAMLVGIGEKNEQICRLEKLLSQAMQQPKIFTQNYQSHGDFIMSKREENISKGNITNTGAQANFSGVAATGENSSMIGVAMGAISGNVTNTISQLPDSDELDKPGIKEILSDLQAAIESDTSLSQEDKVEALEQVKKIAEAAQKPQEEAMQKIAKNALTFLKGLVVDLPSTAELVKTCGNLIPVIKLFFGLP